MDNMHDQTQEREILHERFTLTASDGEMLYGDVRRPHGNGSFPAIVVAHGFKGFKDWGFFPYVAESFARRGYYVVNFNFSHNGIEGNGTEFTRLDKFARNTFSREVRELHEVIDALAAGALPGAEHAAAERPALLGHSRGGGIVLLEAADDPRVDRVATWASVGRFERYTDGQKERWRRDGYLEISNARTGQLMRLDIGLLDDLERNATALNVEKAAARLGRPLLILHGEVDLSVDIANGERLAAMADPELTAFIRIPKTGHTFGIAHPFTESAPALERAIDETDAFFRKDFAPSFSSLFSTS